MTEDISFDIACNPLGIPLPLTVETRGYFGLASPQIRTKWLQHSIP